MKNLKKLLLSFVAMATVISCGDPELPFEIFQTMKTGGYARKMSVDGKFDFFAISTSKVTLEVEYWDGNEGADIASYAISIEYLDKVKRGGVDRTKAKVALKSIDASAFTTNADGYLSSTIELGFAEAMTALGQADNTAIDGGSDYRYHFVITMADGSTYDAATTDSNLESSAPFSALFKLDVSVICPSDLAGTFATTGNGKGAWCPGGDATSGNFEWAVKGSENTYEVVGGDFSYGAYFACYGGWTGKPMGTLKNKDACNVLSPVGASQWGEVYSFLSVARQVDLKVLYIDWLNDYGEGAETYLTRADKDWPDLGN